MYDANNREFEALKQTNDKLPAGLDRKYAKGDPTITVGNVQITIAELRGDDFDSDFIVRVRNNATYARASENADSVTEAKEIALRLWNELQ